MTKALRNEYTQLTDKDNTHLTNLLNITDIPINSKSPDGGGNAGDSFQLKVLEAARTFGHPGG